MKKSNPSNLELQVLSVLWKHGPSTARAVQEVLPDQKQRAYTTVLSVMQQMEKKGLLRHDTEGNRHIYVPLVKKSEVLKPWLGSLLTNVFWGRASAAMQHLLETSEVSDNDLAEMRQVLDEYEKNRRPRQKKGAKK